MYVVKKKSKDGQWYYVAKGNNHEVLNTSETYTTEEACDKGIVAAYGQDVDIVGEDNNHPVAMPPMPDHG